MLKTILQNKLKAELDISEVCSGLMLFDFSVTPHVCHTDIFAIQNGEKVRFKSMANFDASNPLAAIAKMKVSGSRKLAGVKIVFSENDETDIFILTTAPDGTDKQSRKIDL